jgi:hypothetical protein
MLTYSGGDGRPTRPPARCARVLMRRLHYVPARRPQGPPGADGRRPSRGGTEGPGDLGDGAGSPPTTATPATAERPRGARPCLRRSRQTGASGTQRRTAGGARMLTSVGRKSRHRLVGRAAVAPVSPSPPPVPRPVNAATHVRVAVHLGSISSAASSPRPRGQCTARGIAALCGDAVPSVFGRRAAAARRAWPRSMGIAGLQGRQVVRGVGAGSQLTTVITHRCARVSPPSLRSGGGAAAQSIAGGLAVACGVVGMAAARGEHADAPPAAPVTTTRRAEPSARPWIATQADLQARRPDHPPTRSARATRRNPPPTRQH